MQSRVSGKQQNFNKHNHHRYIDKIIEILPKHLYFAIIKSKKYQQLLNTKSTIYLSIDNELVYRNFHNDFGPLNISCLYKYCYKINKNFQDSNSRKQLVHYTVQRPEIKANAAYLIGVYSILYLKMKPKDVYSLLSTAEPYKQFVDALQATSTVTIRLLDCFKAIEKARIFNFFNFTDFNMNEYDYYDKLDNGNLNWIIPRKFVAFLGPMEKREISFAHKPQFYLEYFSRNDIKTVVRLNDDLYDSKIFTNVGIQHFDLYFEDGGVPTEDIVSKFLRIAETAKAAIAVHCKAGLGRTGTLIACYLIKHYHMSAREAVSWLRICRPGSVTGVQQIWLEEVQKLLWVAGDDYRLRHYGDADKVPLHKYGIYSKQWPIDRRNIINKIKWKRN